MSDQRKQPLILAVDDDENSLLVLEGFLFPRGYEVAFAHTGADALEAVKAREPDVVLLDAMMPGMDGFEVARRLKGRPETRHIPILMVTALRHVEDRVRANRCAMPPVPLSGSPASPWMSAGKQGPEQLAQSNQGQETP